MQKSSLSSAVAKMASLLIISMFFVTCPECDAITCDEVTSKIHPCVPYIMVGGGSVPAECCNGVTALMKEASTTADRQKVCTCLKSVASKVNDEQFQRAAGIPKLCGVPLKFKLTRDIDCSKVQL